MSQVISLAEAVDLTTEYRAEKSKIIAPGVGSDVLPLCETFDAKAVAEILSQTDCQHLRVYLGMDEEGLVRLVLVGANSNEEDMIASQDIILEMGGRCPVVCPPASALNS